MPLTSNILMVRPVQFRYNEQTAENNYYQEDPDNLDDETASQKAQREFDAFVRVLRDNDLNVIVVEDTMSSDTPDSVFPNNWVIFHPDGTTSLFPMFAPNRRRERRKDILEKVLPEAGFRLNSIVDFSKYEEEEKFLEGTGSMILDWENKIAYASVSERTDPDLVNEFCTKNGFTPVIFHSSQSFEGERHLIYHTNVMMTLGDNFAVLCADAIYDQDEKEQVISTLMNSGKEIIEISHAQTKSFAGNMLQVINNKGEKLIIMSHAAYESLDNSQISRLEKHGKPVYSNLTTIETCGGGSARCMIAEVFLPKSDLHIDKNPELMNIPNAE